MISLRKYFGIAIILFINIISVAAVGFDPADFYKDSQGFWCYASGEYEGTRVRKVHDLIRLYQFTSSSQLVPKHDQTENSGAHVVDAKLALYQDLFTKDPDLAGRINLILQQNGIPHNVADMNEDDFVYYKELVKLVSRKHKTVLRSIILDEDKRWVFVGDTDTANSAVPDVINPVQEYQAEAQEDHPQVVQDQPEIQYETQKNYDHEQASQAFPIEAVHDQPEFYDEQKDNLADLQEFLDLNSIAIFFRAVSDVSGYIAGIQEKSIPASDTLFLEWVKSLGNHWAFKKLCLVWKYPVVIIFLYEIWVLSHAACSVDQAHQATLCIGVGLIDRIASGVKMLLITPLLDNAYKFIESYGDYYSKSLPGSGA